MPALPRTTFRASGRQRARNWRTAARGGQSGGRRGWSGSGTAWDLERSGCEGGRMAKLRWGIGLA